MTEREKMISGELYDPTDKRIWNKFFNFILLG
mgnify:CR=1 FL=1